MRSKIITISLAIAGLLCFTQKTYAQKASLSTDIMGYANFATMNLEAAYTLGRHWTLNAGVKYNPFTFNLGEGKEFARNRQQSYSVGTRYWPWNIFSGWWAAGKLRYQEYNIGGIVSDATREGERIGAVIAGGYAHMLGKHINIEFGIGLWGGMDYYTIYACPVCGPVEASGRKYFILPSDITVALSYIF